MARSARDKTGDFYKVRSWDPTSVTWMQTKNTYNDETAAIEAATKMAKPDLRVQAIHLVGKNVRKMKLDVVYDSQPEDKKLQATIANRFCDGDLT